MTIHSPFISACLMVKNEEANLERCLSSLQGLVDEIIVVDTGSTDNTINIAKMFDAKVYHHPWEDDFSKHRNQSINYSSGKWILIIDADEEAVCFNAEHVKKILADLPKKYSSVAVEFNDIQQNTIKMKFNTTRFFRKGEVFYQGIVHNQPVQFGKTAFMDIFTLNHYGYDLTPEQKQAKFERTQKLLLKRLAQNEKDYPVYFYLCQLYGVMDMPEKSVEYGEKYIAFKNELPEKSFNKSIYFTLISNLMEKIKDPIKTNRYLKEALEVLPNDLDLTLVTVEYGVWIKNDSLIIDSATEFFKIYNEYSDKTKKQQRFVYSHRLESLAYCQFHATVASFRQGARNMNALFGNLKTIGSEEYTNGTIKELQTELAKCGIPMAIKEKEVVKEG